MTVRELINTYEELYSHLEAKREVLVKRKIDRLVSLDEKIISIYEEIERMVKTRELKATEEEKEEINLLAQKINQVENTNQEVIKYSLSSINKIFEGIMTIIKKPQTGYDQMGKASAKNDLGLSSIVEEA